MSRGRGTFNVMPPAEPLNLAAQTSRSRRARSIAARVLVEVRLREEEQRLDRPTLLDEQLYGPALISVVEPVLAGPVFEVQYQRHVAPQIPHHTLDRRGAAVIDNDLFPYRRYPSKLSGASN